MAGKHVADAGNLHWRLRGYLPAAMSNIAHHPALRRDQQQHCRQSRPVPKLQSLARTLICFHAATLARQRKEVLIDKLCRCIGFTDEPKLAEFNS